MIRVRSPSLFALSTWAFLCTLGWWVTLIVIHSEPSRILPLAEQSLQLFMYTTMLIAAALAACWYADFVRTRASRAAALTATTFCTFAWMWNLMFVIPAFRDSGDSQNLYCSGFQSAGDSDWCAMARASAAFATGILASLFGSWLWALITYLSSRRPEIPIPTHATILAPHHSMISASESGAHNADVNWRTELTEPDDLELMKVAANNPYSHQPTLTRTSLLSIVNNVFTALSLIGWVVLTASLIDIADSVGLLGWDTTEGNRARYGDPIIQSNWYWLTLSLGITLYASSYSSYRRNRGVIGGALLLSALSSLQWISLFIYSARRVADQDDVSTTGFVISETNYRTDAQYAEVAGIGLITLSELIRTGILFIRYATYMLVTKADHDRVHIPSHVDAPTVIIAEKDRGLNTHYDGTSTPTLNDSHHTAASTTTTTTTDSNGNVVTTTNTAPAHHHHHQHVGHHATQEMNIPGPSYDHDDANVYVPSYNMPLFHGASLGFKIIFALTTLTLLAWFVLQIITECMDGLLHPYQTQGADPYNLAGSNNDRTYYYNEYMFLLCTVLVAGAFGPAFFAERELSVASAVASMYTSALMTLGFFLLVWTYAYESIYANGTLYNKANGVDDYFYQRAIQASGVFAMLIAACLLALCIHSIMRLGERYAVVTTWERSRQNIPSSVAWMILAGIGIWAFVTLYYGLSTEGVFASYQSIGGVYQNASYIQSYYAKQAFLVLIACSIAVWTGCYATKLLYAWQHWSWRMATLFSSLLPAAYLIPMIIFACYEINDSDLNNGELALAASIIILCGGTLFYLASNIFLVHSAFYSAGPTGAALPPTGMALRTNDQFTSVKQEQGIYVKDAAHHKDPNLTMMTNEEHAASMPYQQTTTYSGTTQPAVNPRTGDVATLHHADHVDQTTTTFQNPSTTTSATSYQTSVPATGGQEIHYGY